MEKIKILVDDESPIQESKGSRYNLEGIVKKPALKTIEVQLDTLTENVSIQVQGLANALGNVDLSNTPFEIKELTLNLVFDSSGEVKILSSIGGAVNLKSGIQITLSHI